MNDEPHSHKKATAALVAVLLLAYVGSYLWMRQRAIYAREEAYKVWPNARNRLFKDVLLVQPPRSVESWTSGNGLDNFYWPLRKLDKFVTDRQIIFTQLPPPSIHL